MGTHGRVHVEFAPPATYRVVMEGEFDDEEADDLREALCELVQVRDRDVEVDLARVSFIGSAGVAAVLAAFDLAVWSGSRLRVGAVSPPARRLFQVIGLDEVFGPDGAGS